MVWLGGNLGFFHENSDAHPLIKGNCEVNYTFSLCQHCDGADPDVGLPVDQLAHDAIPVPKLVLLTILAIWSHVQLVFEAEIVIFDSNPKLLKFSPEDIFDFFDQVKTVTFVGLYKYIEWLSVML